MRQSISTYRKVSGGKINFQTEVEIQEYVDVDVDVKIADVIDDIIENLDSDQAAEIVALSGMIKGTGDLEGEELKRHLCDLAGVSYTSNKDQIFESLINKL